MITIVVNHYGEVINLGQPGYNHFDTAITNIGSENKTLNIPTVNNNSGGAFAANGFVTVVAVETYTF